MLDIASALLFLSLGVAAFRRVGPAYGFYTLVVVLVAMSATKLFGMPRYVLAAFPAFMVMGDLARWKTPRLITAVLLAAVQVYCIFQFINWKISF